MPLSRLSPRLGAAYQLNSKTVLRASGGIYYATAPVVGTSAAGFSASPAFNSPDGYTPVYNWSASGFLTAEFEAVRVGINAENPAGCEDAVQVLKRLALTAPGIQQHRLGRQRILKQCAQIVERHPHIVVLPSVAAQEQKAQPGFLDIALAEKRFAHGTVLAQICDSIRKRRLGSATNGLRSSHAYPARMELIIRRMSGVLPG